MNKILITGGTGFVGRALCLHLANHGYDIHYTTRGRLIEHNQLKPVVVDFEKDFIDVSSDFDVIIHTAGVAHNKARSDNDYQRLNVDLTENLAQQAQQKNIPLFINLSSIAVYGDRNHIDEQTLMTPLNEYGRSKKKAEEIIESISNSSQTQYISLRPPLIYGNEAPGNLLLIQKALAKGIPLPLGSVSNKRTFLSLDNLVSSIETILNSSNQKSGAYNISDDQIITTSALLKHMINGHWKKGTLVPFPQSLLKLVMTFMKRRNQYDKLCGDLIVSNEKFKEDFNWQPKEVIE